MRGQHGFQVGAALSLEWGLWGMSIVEAEDGEVRQEWDEKRWDRMSNFNIGTKLTIGGAIKQEPFMMTFGVEGNIHALNDLSSDYLSDTHQDELHSRYFTVLVYVGGLVGIFSL